MTPIQQLKQTALRLSQLGTLITFALMPFWLKWPNAPHPFSGEYVLGFVLVVPIVWTIGWWVIAGMPGLKQHFQHISHLVWLVVLVLFCGWAVLSQSWAYMQIDYPGLAQSRALQYALSAAFTLVMASAGPSRKWLLVILIGSMLVHGLIGTLQVIQQGSIGLSALGEFNLDPAESGVSVVVADGTRLLRAYGLLPHPNMLASILLVGLLMASNWALTTKYRSLAVAILCIGLWALLVTFSRSAWLGLALGIGIITILRWRTALRRWWLLVPLGLTSLVFLAAYHPYVLARAGTGQEQLETHSIGERTLFLFVASEAIRAYPVTGVGAGNFTWFASYYIFENSEYRIAGDNVHNIYLTIAAELGLVGLALFGTILLTSIYIAIRQLQANETQIALVASLFALLLIGLFDHYNVTLLWGNAMLFSLLGLAIRPFPAKQVAAVRGQLAP